MRALRTLRIPTLLIGVCLAAILLGLHLFPLTRAVPRDPIRETFARLEKIREVRKKQVVQYFADVHRIARDSSEDDRLLYFFDMMGQSGYQPDENLEYLLDEHYAAVYGHFYDILFVNADGYVFHSVRQEADYHTNLFEGPLAQTKLVQQMQTAPTEHFVEYEYYSPSDEPAAFFVVPVMARSTIEGWIVLQCAINRVNSILAPRADLGRTGEVYLVNQEKWMLTESRFVEDATSLRLRVDTWAVRDALTKGIGTRVVTDYRGVKVLSAFERFDVFGTSWMLLCEIDEAEVLTNHYQQYAGYYHELLANPVSLVLPEKPVRALPDAPRHRVDLNEFAKADAGGGLETYGVATCTAVAIVYPGRFAYLAHIGPEDQMYHSTRYALRRKGSGDLLGEILARMKHYDVYPYELRNLEFTIIAPHTLSLSGALKRILDAGAELEQITFIRGTGRGYANVVVVPADNFVGVVWTNPDETERPMVIDAANVPDLAVIVKKKLDRLYTD